MALVEQVYVSCDASMTVPILQSTHGDSLNWKLRYGDPVECRLPAANVVESYEYLLSNSVTTKEAIRRLRILRKAYQETK